MQSLLWYWLIFAMWAVGAAQYSRADFHRNNRVLFTVAAVLTALFVGLRYDVGGDWDAYQNIYDTIYFQPLGTALTLTDPGYAFFNWMFGQLEINVWAVNLVCACLFMLGVGRLASYQPAPWLALLVAVPYLVIVVAMGYTRQAAAIGILCFGLADASERSLKRLVVYVAVATLFHKTAILMLPLMLAPILTRKPLAGILGCLLFVVLFLLFLRNTTDQLVTNYAQTAYDSQGAAIRVSMNILAATAILSLRKRMGFTPYQQSFWTYAALLSFLSVPALLTLAGSAGVDRLSLFLIPMQLVAFSRLPKVLSTTPATHAVMTIGVIGYSFAVQFVWLNYATNAKSWLPYDNVVISRTL